jgi:hypothetical protein
LQLDEIAGALPDPARLVDRIDQDGDGAISAAEFAEMGDRRRHGGGHGPRGWGFGLFNG